MLIRASRRPAPSPQPALPSRHRAKPPRHPPHPGGLSSHPPPHPALGTGSHIAHTPCASPRPGMAQASRSHAGTSSCSPRPGEPSGGKTGGQVRELATPPVIPQPPATAASELVGIPVVQQVFYWLGLENLLVAWKRQNRSRQTSSGEAEGAGHAALAHDECLSISSPHLPRSQEQHHGHTRSWGSTGIAPQWQGMASPHQQAQSTPRDSTGEVPAGPWLVSTMPFQCPGLRSSDRGDRTAPGLDAAG